MRVACLAQPSVPGFRQLLWSQITTDPEKADLSLYNTQASVRAYPEAPGYRRMGARGSTWPGLRWLDSCASQLLSQASWPRVMGQIEFELFSFLRTSFCVRSRTRSVTTTAAAAPEAGLGLGASLPDSATLEMCTPCSVAMKPRMEKTTKPAKKLVPLLMSARMMASLGAEGTVWAGETACCPRAGRAGVAGL